MGLKVDTAHYLWYYTPLSALTLQASLTAHCATECQRHIKHAAKAHTLTSLNKQRNSFFSLCPIQQCVCVCVGRGVCVLLGHCVYIICLFLSAVLISIHSSFKTPSDTGGSWMQGPAPSVPRVLTRRGRAMPVTEQTSFTVAP